MLKKKSDPSLMLRPQTVPASVVFKDENASKQRNKSVNHDNQRKSSVGNDTKYRRGSHVRRGSQREGPNEGKRHPLPASFDPEKLKADIYREFVGRRKGIDMGAEARGNKHKKDKGDEMQSDSDRPVNDTPSSHAVTESETAGIFRTTGGMMKTIQTLENHKGKPGAMQTPSNTTIRPGTSGEYLTAKDYVKSVKEQQEKESNKLQENMLGLTKEQIKAFREVFDLFDSNGGGTIDADELDNALRSVDICLTKEEINEVLTTIDKDGNGEIDFTEFLQLMTNTERFLETLAINNPERQSLGGSAKNVGREMLLFDALTEFMKKSALKSMDEIVDFYSTECKRFKVPHVVNHYAAGARLIGLTEKQLKEHMLELSATNRAASTIKSPYAAPLRILSSSLDVSHQSRRKTGRIQIKVNVVKAVKQPKAPLRRSQHKRGWTRITNVHGAGWISKHSQHIDVHLPPQLLGSLLPFDKLTSEDVPDIRRQVGLATQCYRHARHREQIEESIRHWQTLQVGYITPRILQDHFRAVFSNYMDIDRHFLKSIQK